ncbi:uncharacterized protein LOC144620608 [Crassostrea virginica]
MWRVDFEGVLFRRLLLKPVQRRVYNARAPLSLWHKDGYHKLIRWRLVIHGGIDGYSRLPVYLRVNNSNRAEARAVLKTYLYLLFRIERFWSDLWDGCICLFYCIFTFLECQNLLDMNNELHMKALHFVFIPRIQEHLDKFRASFIRRPLRTANYRTPLQLWISGQVQDPRVHLTEINQHMNHAAMISSLYMSLLQKYKMQE